MRAKLQMLDLIVVMPVYNEEGCISSVLQSWHKTLTSMGLSFNILVLNDGSKDNTLHILHNMNINNCNIIDKPNSGHGPTIIDGYHIAVKEGCWVFQCDSDNEMEAKYFPVVWEQRLNSDAVIGKRKNREQSSIRSFVSKISRFSIGLLFKKGVSDVNAPYRLIRSNVLEKILNYIPKDTFAPNLVVSGLLGYYKYKIINVEIPHVCRSTGTMSITDLNIIKVAIRALWQIIKIRTKVKKIKLSGNLKLIHKRNIY